MALIAIAGTLIGGAILHHKAKAKNEEAQGLMNYAERLYKDTEEELSVAKQKTESSLVNFELLKKQILQSSMQQFLIAYKRVRNVQIKDSRGLEELSKFLIAPNDIVQLQRMTDIYESKLKVGAIGAVTGVALTALAGTTVVGATGLASFLSPVSVVAAPVVLFTGISSSIKAEENLEKAKVVYSDTLAAVEKMKTSLTMCNAITKRTEMFNKLLNSLNQLFAECARFMDSVTRSKVGLFKGWHIKDKQLNENEIKLIAVTRALAGAVKAVIDTPVLGNSGQLNDESYVKFQEIDKQLPNLTTASNGVQTVDYNVKMLPLRTA